MVYPVFGHDLTNRGDHALLIVAVFVCQAEELDSFVWVDQTA